jgi:hypothetical protein
MTTKQLALELVSLGRDATPGKWIPGKDDADFDVITTPDDIRVDGTFRDWIICHAKDVPNGAQNLRFIAAARAADRLAGEYLALAEAAKKVIACSSLLANEELELEATLKRGGN